MSHVRASRFVEDVWSGAREESVDDLVAADCPGLNGVPATGRSVTYDGATFLRFDGAGRIAME